MSLANSGMRRDGNLGSLRTFCSAPSPSHLRDRSDEITLFRSSSTPRHPSSPLPHSSSPLDSPHTSFLTIPSTRSPIAREDVRPGLSMPSNEMKPGRG